MADRFPRARQAFQTAGDTCVAMFPSTDPNVPLNGATFLTHFESNPALAGHALVTAMNNSPAGRIYRSENSDAPYGVYRDAMREALAAATNSPAKPPGGITRNRTSRPTARPINAAPSRTEWEWLEAAERLACDVLRRGIVPTTVAAQAELFSALIEPVKAIHVPNGLDRRGIGVMEAAALYAIRHTQPQNLTFVRTGQLRRWFADQCDMHDDLEHCDNREPGGGAHAHATGRTALTRITRRPRLLWAHTDGISSGLLLDRMHHTSIPGLAGQDSWVRRKVAEDLTSLADLLRHSAETHLPDTNGWPAVLGVRVLSHRAPNSSLHFPATVTEGRITIGRHHNLGDCAMCELRTQTVETAEVSRTPGPYFRTGRPVDVVCGVSA